MTLALFVLESDELVVERVLFLVSAHWLLVLLHLQHQRILAKRQFTQLRELKLTGSSLLWHVPVLNLVLQHFALGWLLSLLSWSFNTALLLVLL